MTLNASRAKLIRVRWKDLSEHRLVLAKNPRDIQLMITCPSCDKVLTSAEVLSGRCTACRTELNRPDAESPMRGPGPQETVALSAGMETTELPIPKPSVPPLVPPPMKAEMTGSETAGSDTVELGLGQQPNETCELGPVNDQATCEFTLQTTGDAGQTQDLGTADDSQFIVVDPDAAVQATWSEAARDASQNMTIKPPERGTLTPFTSSLVIQNRVVSDAEGGEADIADYDLISRLGEGGMGVVYTARQSSIDRTVALKMLKPGTATSEESQQKFLSEAVVTGELDHPNIVPIYDLGRKDDGTLFYSMKKIQGTPWMHVIREKSLHENLDILLRVADAVAFAHSRGVLHRDLKPENVMLGDFGETLLLDWGLAMTTADCRKADTLPANKTMGGTPSYMAPEMILGPIERIGKHSDIYLLGAILYECVAGSPPHTGKTTMLCIMAAGKNEIVPTDKSGELVDIALKAMATDPADRYASVQEFQAAIRDYQSHSESVALAARAEQELQSAQQSDDYHDFAKALYVFEEAYSLWSANQQAHAGMLRAQHAYAESAYRKGDYDLGLSILDVDLAAHRPLIAKMQRAREERDVRQQRLQRAKKAIIAMAVLVFLAVTIGMLSFLVQKREADRQRTLAIQQKLEADEQRKEAERQRGEAEKQTNVAIEQQRLAEANRKEALEQRNVAELKTEEAEYEAYLAWIGLAAAKIDENALSQARQVLAQCAAPLRDWEWARLAHQCRQSQVRIALDDRIECLAVSDDGLRLAVGGRNGMVKICERRSGKILAELPLEADYASALAFRPGTPEELLIGTGTSAGPLLQWNWATGTQKNWPGHSERVTSVAFTRDGGTLLTASMDQTAKMWSVASGQCETTLKGHTWWVWSAEFSPDETQVVTASQDGTVRLWDRASGEQWRDGGEVMPFRGHASPVYAATFSPDGDWVASGGYDNRLLRWRPDQLRSFDYKQMLGSGQVEQQPMVIGHGHEAAVSSIRFSPDGRYVVTASHDNSMKVWLAVSQPDRESQTAAGTLVKTLRGHGSPVRSVRFLPSAPEQLVSVGHDGDVRMWDIEQYSEQRVIPGLYLRGHLDAVLYASFSPDGKRIVTASRDRTARTWEVSDGEPLEVFREGHAYLTSRAIVFSDGTRLLTAAVDGTVRIWNMTTGAQERLIEGAGYRAAAAVSPNGRWIATGSDQVMRAGNVAKRSARLWNADTGQLVREFTDHKSPVTSLAFSPDNQLLFSGDANGRGNLWEVDTGRLLATMRMHTAKVSAAEFLPDGSRLLTASDDQTVINWQIPDSLRVRADAVSEADGEVVAAANVEAGETLVLRSDNVMAHGAVVNSIAVTRDSQFVLTGSDNGIVRYWDLGGGQLLWSWLAEEAANINCVAVSPIAPLAIVVDAVGNRVHWLNLEQDAATAARPFLDLTAKDALGWHAAFTTDGTGIVTAGGDEARRWDLQGIETLSFRPHRSVTFASFSPDATRVVTAAWDRAAKIWDADSGHAILKLADHVAGPEGGHQAAVNAAVFSPDGQQVLTASDDGTMKLWDATTGWVQRTYRGHTAGITMATFSPDGQQLLSTSRDGTARVWSLANKTPPVVLAAHRGAVASAAFSPDASLVVTGGEDRTTVIWDVDTATPKRMLGEQTDRVTAVAFSPSGTRILTGCADHSVKLWDATTGREVLTLSGHQREVTSVSFSSDGRYALSSSRDGLAIVWPTVAEPLASVALDVTANEPPSEPPGP
jgi:WD40 repeat protein